VARHRPSSFAVVLRRQASHWRADVTQLPSLPSWGPLRLVLVVCCVQTGPRGCQAHPSPPMKTLASRWTWAGRLTLSAAKIPLLVQEYGLGSPGLRRLQTTHPGLLPQSVAPSSHPSRCCSWLPYAPQTWLQRQRRRRRRHHARTG
jgi:hypothetical protein